MSLLCVRVCRRRVSAPLKVSDQGPFPRQQKNSKKGGSDWNQTWSGNETWECLFKHGCLIEDFWIGVITISKMLRYRPDKAKMETMARTIPLLHENNDKLQAPLPGRSTWTLQWIRLWTAGEEDIHTGKVWKLHNSANACLIWTLCLITSICPILYVSIKSSVKSLSVYHTVLCDATTVC